MGSEAVSGSFPIQFSPYEMEENQLLLLKAVRWGKNQNKLLFLTHVSLIIKTKWLAFSK
jgi:hypothetical protein